MNTRLARILAACTLALLFSAVPSECKFQKFENPSGRGFQGQQEIPGINDGGDPRVRDWVERERKEAFGKKKNKGSKNKNRNKKKEHRGL
jgi:hypothetical protein